MQQTTLYFLLDEQKRSGYRDSGNIFWSTNPRPLEFAPEGWSGIGIQNQRNQKYFALDRTVTNPLKFVEDGAQILKNRYYKVGIEAKVTLLIVKLKLHLNSTLTEYGWYYDLLYTGEVDFSQFKDEGTYVNVNIIEGGIAKYIKANDGIKFEFPMDVPEAILVKITGINLQETHNWLIPKGPKIGSHFVPVVFINKEGAAYGLASFSVFTGNSPGSLTASNDYFAAAVQVINGRVKGRVKFNTLVIGSYKLELKSNLGQVISLIPTTALVVGGTYQFDIDEPFTSADSENFFLVATLSSLTSVIYLESNVSVIFKSKFKPTYVKALRPNYLFAQLTDKVTDGNFASQSTLLDTYETVVVVPGDAMRGLANAKCKTSLSDFFTSYNARFGIGLGKLNNKVTIQKKADWIDYTDPIDLGEVSDQVVYPAAEYLFNTWKFGSPQQDYSNVNGRNEFNNTFLFKADYTKITKEYNGIGAYQMDCYGAEEIRINFDGKTLSDSDSDNKIWMLHIQKDPITEVIDGIPTLVYELDRSLNASATGVDEIESVYNLFLSPKHCMYGNGSFIHSCFYKMDHTWLKFVTTEKNHNVSMIDGGILIDEDADEEVAGLDAQLFTPNILDYKTQVPVDFLEILDGNPLKTFVWTYLGIPFMGIPVKDSSEPESEDAQNYQMLSAPTNNLELLEDIFDS